MSSDKYVLLRKAKYEAGELPVEHPGGLRCEKHGAVHRLNMTSYSYRCEQCRRERCKESLDRRQAKVKAGAMPKLHPTFKCETHGCALAFVWDAYRCAICANDKRRALRQRKAKERVRKAKEHVGRVDKHPAPKVKVAPKLSEREERFNWPWEKYAAWLKEHPIPALGPVRRDAYPVMRGQNSSSLSGFADFEEGEQRHTPAKRIRV